MMGEGTNSRLMARNRHKIISPGKYFLKKRGEEKGTKFEVGGKKLYKISLWVPAV